MRFIPFKDIHAGNAAAAKLIVQRINDFAPTRERPYVLGLSVGVTMARIYRRLIQMYEQGLVDFSNVITFNSDEYVDIDKDHPETTKNFMTSNFFQYVNTPSANINVLNGQAEDWESECQRFERKIEAFGGIKLMVAACGSGDDGHIAYNEPYSSLRSKTRHKFLHKSTRATRECYFPEDHVPTEALTMGVGTILDTQELLIVGFGEIKSTSVREAVEGQISHLCTVAAACQMHGKCTLIVDRDACEKLRMGTYRYFKDIHIDLISRFKGIDRETDIEVIGAIDVKF